MERARVLRQTCTRGQLATIVSFVIQSGQVSEGEMISRSHHVNCFQR